VTEAMMLGVAASFLAGSFGYILFQFWLRPMLRYRRIKRRIVSALTDLSHRPAAPAGRPEDLRRLAADLNACYSEQLPDWYQLLLKKRSEDPLKAAAGLMKLAGTRQPGHVDGHLKSVRRSFNLAGPDGRP